MFTYFFTASPGELIALRSEADILDRFEEGKPVVGGLSSRERIDFLSTIFLSEECESIPTGHRLTDGSEFFQVNSELKESIGKAEHETLLDASAPWDEGAWQDTEINRMDLAGFLLEFGELCKSATNAGDEVFFVTLEAG